MTQDPQNESVENTISPQAQREEEILAFWDKERLFEKTLTKESPKGTFVFYDGPPYATGLPHFGHLLPSTVKDMIPRFKTMQGYHVPRKWGWDCHGLPIENLIEKELGLSDKKAIVEYGIDKFNHAARASVFRYDAEWKKIIHRLGRFVDMENAYHTMDPSYTESVWWSFKTLFDKGLVYEGFRSMHVCPRCETTLSNFEVNQGYKDVQDISVYALFELVDEPGTFLLAWTTTPWTLHGNVALAVNDEEMYEKILIKEGDLQGKYVILMRHRKSVLKGDVGVHWETVDKFKGSELVGKSYVPLFDTYSKAGSEFMIKDHEARRANAWKIYPGDFVTDTDGTGIVHIAPAFGDDDYKLGEKFALPFIQHVTMGGSAKPELGEPFAGKSVKAKADPQAYDIEIIKALAHAGKLFAKEKFTHSYPHCWRCDTPLLNYATSAWFVAVTRLQQKFIEENNSVNWIPETVGSGRFGIWLENLRDWNVSRARFWGAPLPVWRGEQTGKIHVIGSVAELKAFIPKRNSYTLIRHGEATCNLTGVINSDVLDACPLTDKGREQVRVSAETLKSTKKITKIYASDFLRTKQTAEIIAETLGIDPSAIIYDKRIRENHTGERDGNSWAEYWASFPDQHSKMFNRATGGESIADVKRRSAEFLYDIDTQNEGEEILVVTHGLPLKMMKSISLGQTARDLVRLGWSDRPSANASLHDLDWRQLPHNESFEIDIHRPYVDHITWTDPESGEKMIRVSDVFDVWYDSGSMPFAQNHYPFEHGASHSHLFPHLHPKKDTDEPEKSEGFLHKLLHVFDKGQTVPPMFPADFIAEGLDQTRGWFYSLLALGVGLFGKVPYRNVSVNGLILAEDGRKMSKSLRNYPPLEPTINKYGVDALRFFLASSPATHAEEVAFSEKGLDEVNKKIFNRIDNVYAFLEMYTSTDIDREVSKGKMTTDELNTWIKKIVHPLDQWIIARLNETLELVTKNLELYVIDKATRPIADFIDDLSTWYLRRSRDRFKGDDLADKSCAMFTTRLVLEQLSRIIAPVAPFMADDIYQKVKFGEVLSVHLESWPSAIDIASSHIIDDMKLVRDIVEKGLALRSEAKIKARQPLASFTYVASNPLDAALASIIQDELNVKEVRTGDAVVLDTVITEELRNEGAVRDLMRAVQRERKNKDLNPGDKIVLTVSASDDVQKSITQFEDVIKGAVGATGLVFAQDVAGEEIEFLESKIKFAISIA